MEIWKSAYSFLHELGVGMLLLGVLAVTALGIIFLQTLWQVFWNRGKDPENKEDEAK